MEDPTPPPQKDDKSSASLKLVPIGNNLKYPKGYRVSGNNDAIERSLWNDETKQYEWVQVLRQVWEVRKVQRAIQSRSFDLSVVNRCGADVQKFEFPGYMLGSNPDLAKIIAEKGCPITDPGEFKEFKRLMGTWLDELREAHKVEDTTNQLGWIREDVEVDETQEKSGKVS